MLAFSQFYEINSNARHDSTWFLGQWKSSRRDVRHVTGWFSGKHLCHELSISEAFLVPAERRRKQERKREKQMGYRPNSCLRRTSVGCSRAKMSLQVCPELGQDYPVFKIPFYLHPHVSVAGVGAVHRGSVDLGQVQVGSWNKLGCGWELKAPLASGAKLVPWRRTWGHTGASLWTILGKGFFEERTPPRSEYLNLPFSSCFFCTEMAANPIPFFIVGVLFFFFWLGVSVDIQVSL